MPTLGTSTPLRCGPKRKRGGKIGSWLFWGYTDSLPPPPPVWGISFFGAKSLGAGCGNEVVGNEEVWEDDLGWREQRLFQSGQTSKNFRWAASWRMDWGRSGVHHCSVRDPPPDGDGGFLAQRDLGLPLPLKVSKCSLEQVRRPLSFRLKSGIIRNLWIPFWDVIAFLKGSLKEKRPSGSIKSLFFP